LLVSLSLRQLKAEGETDVQLSILSTSLESTWF
jgi:hypothetical protein